jgi:hypothetical protein
MKSVSFCANRAEHGSRTVDSVAIVLNVMRFMFFPGIESVQKMAAKLAQLFVQAKIVHQKK